MSEVRTSRVNVVVPTRNRAPCLRELLMALERQELRPFQVIVVNDASADGTRELLNEWQGEGRIASHLKRPTGSYCARNLGWRNADAEIIAFTDDDCLPDPHWLSELLREFDSEEVLGAQGMVVTDRSQVSPFTHQIEQLSGGAPYRTCNMAYRREVLERVGGFDESLRWYADNILGLQVRQFGRIAFAPKAVVHHPPRAREWRDRRTWLERFHADAKHRAELQRLKAEPFMLPEKVLPLALWTLRPLAKQSVAHLKYFLQDPVRYSHQISPLAREKWEMILALRDFWRGAAPFPYRANQPEVAPRLSALADSPRISAIVVTKHRAGLLEGTLQALDRQGWRNREVVVVDHGPDPETRAIAIHSGSKYITATGSLAAARQTGVDASMGEIVAFTDDDCLPDSRWLEELAASFMRDTNLLGVQGKTVAENGPIGVHRVSVSKPNSLYQTCNMAYRREAISAVGGFDLSFEGWFEDTALGARVLANGEIGFAPGAIVTHRSAPRSGLRRCDWTRLLRDELKLATRYPAFYRKTRGPGFLMTVLARWVVGSTLKSLAREAPRAMRNPRGYLHLMAVLMRERQELLAALSDFWPWHRVADQTSAPEG